MNSVKNWAYMETFDKKQKMYTEKNKNLNNFYRRVNRQSAEFVIL